MPIYAYKCSACAFEKDVLQKMSAEPLTDCPECGKSTFSKQLTAAGFQLKGSGWYVTDFRNGGKSAGASSSSSSEGTASSSSGSDSSGSSTAAAPSAPSAPASTS